MSFYCTYLNAFLYYNEEQLDLKPVRLLQVRLDQNIVVFTITQPTLCFGSDLELLTAKVRTYLGTNYASKYEWYVKKKKEKFLRPTYPILFCQEV